MKFVEGRTLNKIIGKEVGPIPYEEALPLFIQILEKFSSIHRQEGVHSVLEPSNIIITPDNKIKIADNNTAHPKGRTQMPKTGTKRGTLFYLSPEQVRRENADEQSNIYSLGIILYEMLAGRVPFDNDETMSDFTLVNKIISEKPNDPREFNPHIPEWLINIIYEATAKEKSARIKTTKAFISLLKTGKEIFEKKVQEKLEKEKQLQKEKEDFEKIAREKLIVMRQLKKEKEIARPIVQKPYVEKQNKGKVTGSKPKKKKITGVLYLIFWIALTSASFLIIYDNKAIDNEWMAENLNVDHYRNGDIIPEVKDSKKWATLKTGAWCNYNNEPENGKKYGKLYNWYAVNDPRGLAPEGWNIPTKNEFEELIKVVNNDGNASKTMGQESGKNTNGFSLLLAGGRDSTGYFYDLGYVPYFWSSTEYDAVNAYDLALLFHDSYVTLSYKGKGYGFSVRCFKKNKKLELIQ